MLCSSHPGDYFELKGEVLSMPPGQGDFCKPEELLTLGFSIYSLGVLLPLLPAKQRAMSKADWMSREGGSFQPCFHASSHNPEDVGRSNSVS
jgi:hypothetical protein